MMPTTLRAPIRARLLPKTARRLLSHLARNIRNGTLVIEFPDGDCLRLVGRDSTEPAVHWRLNNFRPLLSLLQSGAIGFAESYMDGDWDSDSLPSLLNFAGASESDFGSIVHGSRANRLWAKILHRRRANSERQARRNISHHYDLGNTFYQYWLDETMTYSSAMFDRDAQSLADAQRRKYAHLSNLVDLVDGDEVLEIGCGWGGFMQFASQAYDVAITGVSISNEQCRFVDDRLGAEQSATKLQVQNCDYRHLEGEYDRIVSIEMFEAVGEAYWDTYAAKLKSLLRPSGTAALQVITIAESHFESYRRNPDFVQKYIFPGGMLPSYEALVATFAGAGLRVTKSHRFGLDYANTLVHWRDNFDRHWPAIRALGFSERFRRMWHYYFAYCEAGFRLGVTDVVQVRLEHAE